MVLFGGRSGEHEISVLSATSVIKNLDSSKYDIIPVGIDKSGKWILQDLQKILEAPEGELKLSQSGQLVSSKLHEGVDEQKFLSSDQQQNVLKDVDVVFPVLHGPLYEDGNIQGILNLLEVPFVGAGVLASAIGMEKDVAKRLVSAEGINVGDFQVYKKQAWISDQNSIVEDVKSNFSFPVFVKPVNMGSSVGIHKVQEESELASAMNDAYQYDRKVIVEAFVPAREIEVAVLENINDNLNPLSSVPGEIIPNHEFYSYESKYLDDDGAELKIPAALSPAHTAEAQAIARDIFVALECEGMARVDLFLDKGTNKFIFNEVNTLPGFTKISMYPKMWEASGLSYMELLDKLIELAEARHVEISSLKREK